MNNERFTLTAEADCMWLVSDKETGFSIRFREGLFNVTQEVSQPETLPDGIDLASWAARAMSSIGDYMAHNHYDLATCNIEARRMAVWMLANEKYWITIAAACNSLLIDFDRNEAQFLLAEVEDYINLSGENPAGLTDAEKVNLLGSLSMLEDEDANEVFNLCLVFWHEYYDAGVGIETWAHNLLWWPAWSDNIKTGEDGEN